MVQEIAEYSCFLGIADYKGAPQAIFVKTATLVLIYQGHKIYRVEELDVIDLREGDTHNTFSTALSKVRTSHESSSLATSTLVSPRTSPKGSLFLMLRTDTLIQTTGGEPLSSVISAQVLERNGQSTLLLYFFFTQGFFKEYKLTVKDKAVTVIVGARKSVREGYVYPHNFGVNTFGECANYVTYEIIASTEAKSLCYVYSTSTPPVDVVISPEGKVIPNCCDEKMVRVSEAFINWITPRKDVCNQWVLMRSGAEPNFGVFNPIIDKLIEDCQGPSLRVIDIDLNELNINNLKSKFEGSHLQFAIYDGMSKQGPINLKDYPEGFKSATSLISGKTHFCVFSLHYSAYLAHFSVIYSLVMMLLEHDELAGADGSFKSMVDLALELEYALFCNYDRGRGKSLSVAKMGEKFNQPITSSSRNASTAFASRCLGVATSLEDYNHAKARLVFSKAEQSMVSKIKTKITVISWNVAGFSPKDSKQIEGLLACFDKTNMPDIIAIGLQEVVELKSSNIARFFTSNSKENDDWVRCIKEVVDQLDPDYSVLGYQRMVGLFSLTLIHNNFKKHIFNLGIKEVKTGFMGIVGNKGSVISSLKVSDSLVHFCNTHLPSGDSVGKRASCVEDLYKEFCENQVCDAFFLFGDLNFRVQMDLLIYKNVMDDFKLSNPAIDFPALMAKDEVKLNLHPCLNDHFKEAPLPKAPTYRLVRNTETFSDDRVASW